jgi:hypothetical protein
MPKSLEKVTLKIKWLCHSKAIKKAANQRRAAK